MHCANKTTTSIQRTIFKDKNKNKNKQSIRTPPELRPFILVFSSGARGGVVPDSVNSIVSGAALLLPNPRRTAVEVQDGRRARLTDEDLDERGPGQRVLVYELQRGEQRRHEDLLGPGPAAQEHVLRARGVRHGVEAGRVLRMGGQRCELCAGSGVGGTVRG